MRRRARTWARATTVERRLVALGTAVHAGLWLGVLDRADLHAVDAAHYGRASRYVDEAYLRGGLFGWEREALAEHFPSRGRILVLGAGAGREMLALLAMGFDVVGYEPHPLLVSTGRALLGGAAPLHLIGRDEVPTTGDDDVRYDGVVVGWSTYTLVSGSTNRRLLLRQLRGLLDEDAPVLLSFFTRPADDVRSRVVAGVGGAVRRVRGRPPVELGDDLAPNAVHRFTEQEVADELAAGGFVLTHWSPEGSGRTDSGWAVGRAVRP